MSDIAISLESVSKYYRLGQIGTGTLSHDLNRWWARIRGKEDPFQKIGELNDRAAGGGSGIVWALEDISLEFETGDVVGVIGRNGAGKSTLLKILSKVTGPSSGTLRANGRIASLLEVGTGFHPEMSGRENVYMNGTIMGMSKREIDRRFDEIIDFAGVAKYVDTPVKRYSSGMLVRLGFAVAAHLNSEILVVDEVLAVGDAEFQQKAIGKMQDINKDQGRTVLFVSHNISAVNALCTSGIVLDKGKLIFSGTSIEATRCYYDLLSSSTGFWNGDEGDENVRLRETRVYAQVEKGNSFSTEDDIYVSISLFLLNEVSNLVVGFHLLSEFGSELAYVLWNDYEDKDSELKTGHNKLLFRIPRFTLTKGSYRVRIDLGIHDQKFITRDHGDLSFQVNSETVVGCRYPVLDVKGYSSLLRPNWFHSKSEEN